MGSGDGCHLAGLWHDLGKYQDAFPHRILAHSIPRPGPSRAPANRILQEHMIGDAPHRRQEQ